MSDTAVIESGTRLQNFLDRAGLRGFPWKTATILYTISWGWLFIVRDSYWADDWDTLKFPQLGTFDFRLLGLAPWTSVIGPLHSISGAGFLRILIFGSFFASALAVFGISNQISSLALWQRRVFVLLFLLLPFNHIRVALMTFHYTTGIFLFYLAWYLITAFKSKKVFCTGLVLFFLSFQMHSLLFLYLLPVTHFAFINQSNTPWFLRIKIELISLVTLPLTYVVLRYFFWPERIRYHNLDTSSVSSASLFIVVAIGGTYLIFVVRSVVGLKMRNSAISLLVLGLFCSLLALLPYLLAGFYKTSLSLPFQFLIDFVGRSEYRSRHLALQPLGFSIFLVGLLTLIEVVNIGLKKLLFGLILVSSLLINLQSGFEYWIDFSKQNTVVAALHNFDVQNSSVKYQVFDRVPLLNAQAAANRFIWKNLVAAAYGEDYAKNAEIESVNKCVPFDGSNFLIVSGPKNHFEAVRNWMKSRDFGFLVKVGVMNGRCLPEMARVSVKTESWPVLFFFRGANFEIVPYPSSRQLFS